MSIVSKSSQYYSGFSPLLIPGCSLWLDAADTSSLTLSGSNVTSWRDKSGNGRNAVVSSNAYATLSGTPQGLLFNNSFYTTTLSADPAIETGFVVYNVSSAGVLVGAYNAGREIAFQSLTIVGVLKAQIAWGAVATTAGNVRQLVTTFASSSATSSAVNGGTAVTAAGLTFTSGNVTTLGREVGTNFPYGGLIHEIILFNANLTAPQRQQVEGYLAGKWGLRANIPTTHPFKSLTPFARPFVPIDISGCSLWLDAADSRTVVLSGADVTQWSDKSGNARHATQTTTTLRPTYSTDRNAIVFPNLKYLNMTDAFNMLSAVGRFYSIYVVERRRSNKVQNFMVAFGGGSGNVGIAFGYNDNTTFSHTAAYVTDTLYAAPGYQVTDPIRIWSGGYNGAIRDLVLNGTTVTTTNPYTYAITGWTQPCIGFLPLVGINQYFVGDIHEILFYNSYLTVTQRQQIETYLANKWSIVGSTPVAHPARLTRALVPSFNPRLIVSCALWLDAADPTSITLSGSNVTQWNDKSGNIRNFTQATTANQPSYLQSETALVFNGTSSSMTSSVGLTTVFPTPSAFNIFVVGTPITAGTNSANPYDNGAFIGDSGGYHGIFIKQTNTVGAYIYDSTNVTRQTTQTVTLGNRALFNLSLQSTALGLYLTGNTPSSVSAPQPLKTVSTAPPNPLILIGTQYQATGRYLNCKINEILIFGFLTISERQSIEGYLANKWGIINNLPSAHPFKVLRP